MPYFLAAAPEGAAARAGIGSLLAARPPRIAASAARRLAWRNTKPLSAPCPGRRAGRRAAVPRPCRRRARRSGAAGRRSNAGRCRARPSSRANVALRTGSGAVAFTAPVERRIGDRVRDQPHQVVARDPGHPLPARSRSGRRGRIRTGSAGLRQHAAFGAEHEADAQPHHAHAEALGLHGRALPVGADAGAE